LSRALALFSCSDLCAGAPGRPPGAVRGREATLPPRTRRSGPLGATRDRPFVAPQNAYVMLDKVGLQAVKEEAIERVKNVLYVTRDQAVRVLRHYQWDPSRASERWFTEQVTPPTGAGAGDSAPSPTSASRARPGGARGPPPPCRG